jgi:hypothetical protein
MFLIVVPLRRVIIMGILICRASVLQMVMQVALQDIGQLTDIRAAASGSTPNPVTGPEVEAQRLVGSGLPGAIPR